MIGKHVFNDWTIRECIGKGSFGSVYRITREDFGREYEAALKVIEVPKEQAEVDAIRSEGLEGESVTEYFMGIVEELVEEFALMSKLKGNSNIVSYEYHSVVPKEDGFGWNIYIRMELLKPFTSYIKEHTMTVRDVIKLGIDMCQALEVCQKYNIIHRDIKLENIFVSNIGDFKLGDFGIARQLEKTSSGLSKKGTSTYMAPEIYKGLPYNSTVDIYSLGIVLYRLLNNNRSPFLPAAPTPIRFSDREKANVMRLNGEKMPNPCNARGRLAEIVLKACAYDPKERYGSAYEMRQDLQSVLYAKEERKEIEKDPYENKEKEKKTEEKFVNSSSESDEKGRLLKLLAAVTGVICIAVIGIVGMRIVNKNDNNITDSTVAENSLEEDLDEQEYHAAGNEIENKAAVTEKGINIEKQDEKAIPDLVSLKQDEAVKNLNINGFQVKVVKEFSEDVKSGKVIRQEPDSGEKVKKGSEVIIYVSKGAEKISVPKVTGLSVKQAKSLLNERKLKIKLIWKYHNSIAKGKIIAQKPKEKVKVKKNTVVTLKASKGIKKVKTPSVIGLSEAKAKTLLKKNKLKVKITYQYHDFIEKGLVVDQSIEKGKKIAVHTLVNISVSLGRKEAVTPKAPDTSPETTEKKTTPKEEKKKGEQDSNAGWHLVN